MKTAFGTKTSGHDLNALYCGTLLYIFGCFVWLLKVYTRFVLKNNLTATYQYFRAENSSTGCTNKLRGFC